MAEYYDIATTTYDALIRELHAAKDIQKKKRCAIMSKTRNIMILILSLVAGILFLLQEPFVLLLFIAIVFLIVFLVVFMIVTYNTQKTLLYDRLYPNAVEMFNYEHDATFTYEFAPKLERSFNQEMGLFPRGSSISCKFRMTGQLESSMSPTLQLCSMVTSNGQSSTTHFNGVYIIIPKHGIPTQQIRSSGRSRLKGIKMERLENYEERVYLPEDERGSSVNPMLMQLYHEASNRFDLRAHYIASNNNEVHVALWFRRMPNTPKVIDYASLESVVESIHGIMNYTIEITHTLEELMI